MQEIKKINLSLELRKFSELTINFDKERIPLSSSERESKKGKYPYYGAQGIIDYLDEYIFNGEYLLIAEDGENLNSRSQPIANVVSGKFWVNNHAHIVKTNSECDIHYLCYLLNNTNISGYITGSAQPKLNQYNLNNMVLEIQDYETQYKISKILKGINDKIRLNEEINKNLELYLFYIFDETFMNLEFNEFSNSQDKIPLSWNLGTFNDIIESLGSGDWGKDELTGNYTSEVYCIRGADIPDVKQGNKGKMPIRYILSKNFQNKKLNENTIVLEISGGSPTQSTGRTVFITEDFLNRFDKDLICTNFCKVIKPALNYEIFIYLYFNYLYDKDVMFAYENGTTGIKNFDIKSFINNFLIVIPSQEDVINFNKLVKDVFDIIMHNGLEIEKLQQLRDTLLPKLMSGEIDVSKINCDLE